MISIGQNEKTKSPVPIPISVSALVVGLIGTLSGVLVAICYGEIAQNIFAWSAMAGLSGMVMALLERDKKGSSVCFGSSLVLFALNLLLVHISIKFNLSTLFITAPFIGVSVVAPFVARRFLRRDISVGKYYLTIWLAPPLFYTVSITAYESAFERSQGSHFFGFVLSSPFGPFATQVARLFSFPNAGEFFYLPTACSLTVAVATILYLAKTRRDKAAYWIIPFAWLMIGWSAIGITQLVCCIN